MDAVWFQSRLTRDAITTWINKVNEMMFVIIFFEGGHLQNLKSRLQWQTLILVL